MLVDVVDKYMKKDQQLLNRRFDNYNRMYESQVLQVIPQLKAICDNKILVKQNLIDGKILFPDTMLKVDKHQCHIHRQGVIEELEEIINENFYIEIKKMKEVNKDFEELYNYVDSHIHHIKYVGALCIYDLALRLGASVGILPVKFVYASRGAADGLKYLGIKIRNNKISINDIPYKELTALGAAHIEHFACAYKKELKNVRIM